MTYQEPTSTYNNADASSSSYRAHVADASSSSSSSVSLGQEEAMAAKKQKHHARPVHVAVLAGVCVAGIMLLVAAGRYSAGAATATAAATGSVGSNSLASVVSLQKEGGGKFYTCEIAEGTFQQRSCAPYYSQPTDYYYSICVDSTGHSYWKSEGAAETCFGLGSEDGDRCWTKYHYISEWDSGLTGWNPCVPRDTGIHGTPPVAWQYAKPRHDGSCGNPCNFGFTDKFPSCYWCNV